MSMLSAVNPAQIDTRFRGKLGFASGIQRILPNFVSVRYAFDR